MKYFKPLPSRELILSKLQYDADTGAFTRRRDGRPVGFKNAQGYAVIKIGREEFMAHRLAYKILTGEDPASDIDHKHERDDNAAESIRAASYSQNRVHTGVSRRNTSGIKGVSRSARTGKWAAAIAMNGVKHHLGWFDSKEEAGAAYQAAALKLQGEFIHETVRDASYDVVPKRKSYTIGASGIRGVTKHGDQWQATYRKKHLGTFPTKDEAGAAVSRAAYAMRVVSVAEPVFDVLPSPVFWNSRL